MKSFIIHSILCLVFISCSNDDETTSSGQGDNSFFALKIANEWNYEYFRRQGDTENFLTTDVTINQKITSVETINGEDIYTITLITTGNPDNSGIFPNNGETFIRVKDSLGYLVDLHNGILFSSEEEEDYLITSENFGDIFGRLENQNENIEVAGENLNSKINERYAILESGEISQGRARIFYAEEKGQTLETISFVNSLRHTYEKRLFSFSLSE